MKLFFILSLFISISAMADAPYQDSRSRNLQSDVYLKVGNCQTTGQFVEYMPLTTSLSASVRRTTVSIQETRTCRKTGWFSKSCTPWKRVSQSRPVVSIATKNAFYETSPKCVDDTLPGVISDSLAIMSMMDNCQLMRQTILEEIRKRP